MTRERNLHIYIDRSAIVSAMEYIGTHPTLEVHFDTGEKIKLWPVKTTFGGSAMVVKERKESDGGPTMIHSRHHHSCSLILYNSTVSPHYRYMSYGRE